MKRTPLRRRAPLRGKTKLRRSRPLERTASMAATDAQSAAVAGRTCIVCGADRRIDPAHLLSGRRPVGMCVLPACSLVGVSAEKPDEGVRAPDCARSDGPRGAAVRARKHAAASRSSGKPPGFRSEWRVQAKGLARSVPADPSEPPTQGSLRTASLYRWRIPTSERQSVTVRHGRRVGRGLGAGRRTGRGSRNEYLRPTTGASRGCCGRGRLHVRARRVGGSDRCRFAPSLPRRRGAGRESHSSRAGVGVSRVSSVPHR
jgi:hypothetical protein